MLETYEVSLLGTMPETYEVSLLGTWNFLLRKGVITSMEEIETTNDTGIEDGEETVTISVVLRKSSAMLWEESTEYMHKAVAVIERNLWAYTAIVETNINSTRP